MADFTGSMDPDTWFGTSGNDTAHGGGGNDRLFGNDGDDQLYGEEGDDFLVGGPGNDLVDGGEGNDTLAIVANFFPPQDLSAGDQFIGGNGFDTFFVSGDFFTPFDLTGAAIAADIEAIRTYRATVTIGHARFSQFSKMEGDFRLTGSGTLDLSGGRLAAGSLFLDSGDDIVSLAGNVVSLANDAAAAYGLSGGGGNDQLIGSESGDSLQGGDGADRLEGRGGNDSISDGDGNDTVFGGDGNDVLWDGAGDDTLDGGAGDDQFILNLSAGFSAADRLSGGTGIDTLSISTPNYATVDLTTANIANDFERVIAVSALILASAARVNQLQYFEALGLKLNTAGNVVLSDSFKVHQFELSDLGNGVDLSAASAGGGFTVLGGAGADTITGSVNYDTFYGGGGNDVIHAGNGNDEIFGGAGADWLDGGGGDDMLKIEETESVSAGDRFTGGAGTDTLFIGGPTYNGPMHIVDFTGATIDADIERIAGASYGGGRFYVAQLAGFSRIQLQELYLANGGAIDFSTRETSISYLYLNDAGNLVTLSDFLVAEVIGGAGNDVVAGRGRDDVIRGNGGNDTLLGGAGSDLLIGGDGNDVLNGGTAAAFGLNFLVGGTGDDTYYVEAQDIIQEAAGQGSDAAYASVDYVLSASAEVEYLSAVNPAATTALNLTGNEFAQQLVGNAGNNMIDGGGGADTMAGGAGNDVYVVDVAGDAVIENSGQGTDEIRTGLAVYSLAALPNVENLTGTSNGAQSLGGNAGNNVIRGGGGTDRMTGGAGADTFVFAAVGDSQVAALRSDGVKFMPDAILDFTSGQDKIDLSAIDAVAGGGDDPFTFIGTGAFTRHAGELRYEAIAGQLMISADVNGDGTPDLQIMASGSTLLAGDFVL
ncbi:MAG: hypothetical protein QOH47_457 [Sphingomonadales bacterium]|jgi:Ca2+-binding RTX toxin-like protein|nr:hypothetical protein [Sphingomonadales bacterium]